MRTLDWYFGKETLKKVGMVKCHRSVLDVIEEEMLQERINKVGKTLMGDLRGMSQLKNVRGKGTMIAWDMVDGLERDLFAEELHNSGLLVGKCGNKSIRLRPSLNFDEKDAEVLSSMVKTTLVRLSCT